MGKIEKAQDPCEYQKAVFITSWEHPLAIFRFKYRSKEDLQKMFIIPRTPSPEPPVSVFDDLPDDRIQTFARYRHMQNEDQRMRRRPGDPQYYVRDFNDLSSDEIKSLAREQWEIENGGPQIKPRRAQGKHSKAHLLRKRKESTKR